MDFTHDPARRSWVKSGQDHPNFPIQNLPFGVFRRAGMDAHVGIAIGDDILDLAVIAPHFQGLARKAAEACSIDDLRPLMALGASARVALRESASEFLDEDSEIGKRARGAQENFLFPQSDCVMQLPTRIGDYTDFYAGIQHARNVGKLFRPDAPLLPNYYYIPVGYHGRSSTVQISGAPVRRPNGQLRRRPDIPPDFGPSERLDYEVELAVWIGAGNNQGEPIPIDHAGSAIWGLGLLNDWSARDIQAWEYQPLGPFLAKSFATTVSPWVITPEALEPFRAPLFPRGENEPAPLKYLNHADDQATGGLHLEISVFLSSSDMRERGLSAARLSNVDARHLYWTFAQLVAHQTSNGCSLSAGDLLGTGTISGVTPCSFGSLIELTEGGVKPIELPDGEHRTFLRDGDEITLQAKCTRPGFASVGFGECRALVLSAPRSS